MILKKKNPKKVNNCCVNILLPLPHPAATSRYHSDSGVLQAAALSGWSTPPAARSISQRRACFWESISSRGSELRYNAKWLMNPRTHPKSLPLTLA